VGVLVDSTTCGAAKSQELTRWRCGNLISDPTTGSAEVDDDPELDVPARTPATVDVTLPTACVAFPRLLVTLPTVFVTLPTVFVTLPTVFVTVPAAAPTGAFTDALIGL